MYSKIIINIFLIISLYIVQVSFISGLPTFFRHLNLVIVVLIFILGLTNFKLALWWSMGIGILFDIYSFAPFGIYLISLLATVLLANFLLSNFFTNRSLYSFLALTFFAYLGYEFFIYFFNYFTHFFTHQDFVLNLGKNLWLNELSQLIVNLFVVLIVFYLLGFVSSRLKPVFLIRRRG